MISRRSLMAAMAGGILLPSSSVAYAVAIEPYWFKVKRYKVNPGGLAGLRLRVAVLADLHTCEPFMTADHVRTIVELTNALEPDLVMLLGDYLGDHRLVLSPVRPAAWTGALAGLRAPLGVHAVLGNHDWWDDKVVMRRRTGAPRVRHMLEDAGIPVYENDARRLVKDGRAFWIAGLGDQWAYYDPSWGRDGKFRWKYTGVDDIGRVLGRITDNAPVLLMAHEPDAFAEMPSRINLTVSGHMHGGQVRIGTITGRLPSKFGSRYLYGHIVEDNRHLIVSGGLGCSKLPVRLGAPPEVVLIEVG